MLDERLAIALAEDVVADHLGFGQAENHQIGSGEGTGGQGFLVLHLAVDDRGEGMFLVLLHRVPHLRHPGTGGVDDVTAPLVEELHLLHRGAEGRQDHHITDAHSEKSLTPSSTWMNITFISRRWSFTEGLWMISLVIQIRSVGK